MSLVRQDGDISKLLCYSSLTLWGGHAGFRALCKGRSNGGKEVVSSGSCEEKREEKYVIRCSPHLWEFYAKILLREVPDAHLRLRMGQHVPKSRQPQTGAAISSLASGGTGWARGDDLEVPSSHHTWDCRRLCSTLPRYFPSTLLCV